MVYLFKLFWEIIFFPLYFLDEKGVSFVGNIKLDHQFRFISIHTGTGLDNGFYDTDISICLFSDMHDFLLYCRQVMPLEENRAFFGPASFQRSDPHRVQPWLLHVVVL